MPAHRPRASKQFDSAISITVRIEGEPPAQSSALGRLVAALRDLVRAEPTVPGAERIAQLTVREHELAAWLAAGASEEQIAERLHIATGTVHSHRKRIYLKLGIHTRAELAALRAELGDPAG